MSLRPVVVVMLFTAACLAAPFVGVGQAGGLPPRPVGYQAPVPGPIVDPFRPPPDPYSAGNRGVDYRTRPGEPVVASAGGTVLFAGPVAGRLVVVLLHADGLRTSYTGLGSIAVRQGEQAVAGQRLGVSASALQFGVRAGRAYLDPAVLLDASRGPRTHAHLVPERSP